MILVKTVTGGIERRHYVRPVSGYGEGLWDPSGRPPIHKKNIPSLDSESFPSTSRVPVCQIIDRLDPKFGSDVSRFRVQRHYDEKYHCRTKKKVRKRKRGEGRVVEFQHNPLPTRSKGSKTIYERPRRFQGFCRLGLNKEIRSEDSTSYIEEPP